MKVILLRNVENLGREGDIKEVSSGYARNFLFPRQLADTATPELIKHIEKKKSREEKNARVDLELTEKTASSLDGMEFEIFAPASSEGRLYAAIGPAKIVSVLRENGIEINKKNVSDISIKEVGAHEVILVFSHGLEAKIMLDVKEKE